MSKCEKCYHNKVCIDGANHKNVETCKHFKDKELIAELPCNVDDELFEISGGEIYIWKVIEITIDSEINFECRDTEFEDYYGSFTQSDIGKKIFLTFEEATKALKERENNDG